MICGVPGAGLEPARPFGQRILSPQRLPISPPGPKTNADSQLLERGRRKDEQGHYPNPPYSSVTKGKLKIGYTTMHVTFSEFLTLPA